MKKIISVITLFIIIVLFTLSTVQAQVVYNVKYGDTLWKISQKFNTPIQELINNNNLKYPYQIYIGEKLKINKAKTINTVNSKYITYTIKSGDILWNIAQKYNTTVQKIVELNNIKNAYDLYIGRKIIVPVSTTANYQNNNNNSSYYSYYFYEVSSGDKIWNIADSFGVRVSDIIEKNNINNINNIQPGDILIIPLQKSNKLSYLRRTASKLNNYFRVRSNQTLTEIAEFYNVPEKVIRRINNLNNNENIQIGTRLLMPVNSALFKKHQIYTVKNGGEYIFDIAYNFGISINSILKANYLQNKSQKFDAGITLLIPLDENSKTTWIEYKDGKPVNSLFFS